MEGTANNDMDLSLVVPCYNEAPHLKASALAVMEVLDQTRYNYEIVFVDDCSQDNTRAVIIELCSHSKRCRYIFHEKTEAVAALLRRDSPPLPGALPGSSTSIWKSGRISFRHW
ncbi:MAG: glycosyltransferase [Acidobacteria bacterium]|nr:glycosyltransferase [Acidobacteriota bacterium]